MSTQLSIPQEQNTAVALIREAISTGADPSYLRELLNVRREWEADEARKAYFWAISEFQKRAPIIEKADDAHGKSYARMDRIWRTVRGLFTELGLSCTWQVCTIKDGICHVEGQLAHVQGHSIPLMMDVALPELIRGQNAAQQGGSARTYAQRYAFCAACGLQTGEDDDAAALTAKITKQQADDIRDLLVRFDDPRAEAEGICNWLSIGSIEEMPLSCLEMTRREVIKKLEKQSK